MNYALAPGISPKMSKSMLLFKNQLLAYQAAPDVYKARTYLQPFMNISTNVRFFVKTTTNRNDLFQLDLQEKITADMSDLVIPGKK